MRAWACTVALVTLLSYKWLTSSVKADSVYCDDPELCGTSQQILQFGQPVGLKDIDPYFRDRKQFMRFGRDDELPDIYTKRFLRFGRRQGLSDADVAYLEAMLKEPEIDSLPVYRKRRSVEVTDQQQISPAAPHHRSRRSAELAGQQGMDEEKSLSKRDALLSDMEAGMDGVDNIAAMEDDDLDQEKRFMRFGKKMMPFKKSDPSLDDFADKRFMRFGKRFTGLDGASDKRFMRFGKSVDLGKLSDKRFMRFGKSLPTGSDKRFMRFGRGLNVNSDKRFMRFGRGFDSVSDKRFMRFGKGVNANSLSDKRFMRFGRNSGTVFSPNADKRFMRFGRNPNVNDLADKRFMRFGKSLDFGSDKRFMRFGKRGLGGLQPLGLDGSTDEVDLNSADLLKK